MSEWISKILSIVKIPLGILLPAVCLFSAFFIFATDEVLDKLGMLTWSQDNKFTFGISFIISLSLLLVYSISYLASKIIEIYHNKTQNKKALKGFGNLSDKEIEIILYLYKSDGFTNIIDYANPIIKGLIYRNYIFIGNSVPCQIDWNNRMMIQGTLQPFIWQALDWLCDKSDEEITKLQQRKSKIKDKNKKDKIDKEIAEIQEIAYIIRR